MKVSRRDLCKVMFGTAGILSVLPGKMEGSAVLETVDSEECVLVFKVYSHLSEDDRSLVQKNIADIKIEYPQLKDIPMFLVDEGADIEILRLKGKSKI